ncbi:2-dehydropantoate 2-reductase [Saccharibacillus sp. O23]|uniref:ketopantoate reductase family protein n=1 Tax=Saccharibacillus sp. O23 TaxID=2009338 RepID=UPI000B4E7C30|nr:2-dehydropantoate 2-reductase N-terminal domain-containing protein [Saccharibacillus sp. O23]OWR32726.1 2-dehydropantoate 2-reductase [Saccharibacillus sp. O23]
MKILVYGAGVLGGALAHILIQAGNEVTILARGRRAEQLEQDGLVIRHYVQRRTTVDRPAVVRSLEPGDRYDLIFTVMKYSDIEAILPALAANISEHLVMVGNNPDIRQTQAEFRRLGRPEQQTAFAFQISAGTRQEEGRIVSILTGGGRMVAGMTEGTIPFMPLLREAFAGTRYKVSEEGDIEAWLKNHIVPIVPLSAAVMIRGRNARALAGDKKLLRRVIEAMEEGFDRLEAASIPLVPSAQAKLIRRYQKTLRVLLGLYHRMPIAQWVDGSLAEIEALDRVFQEWKHPSGRSAPAWAGLVEEVRSAQKKPDR